MGVCEDVTLRVGVTLGVTDIVDEEEGVAPNDSEPVGLKEMVGVHDGVGEVEAPNENEGVVDGEVEGVLVLEVEIVGEGVAEGAATRVNPVDDKV